MIRNRSERFTALLISVSVVICLLTACGNSIGTAGNVSEAASQSGGGTGVASSDGVIKTEAFSEEANDAAASSGELSEAVVSSEEATDTAAIDGANEAESTASKVGLAFKDIEGCSGAVFGSDGRLFVCDAKNGSIKEIDVATGAKNFIGLSPDKTMAAYSYSPTTERMSSTATKIGICDLLSGKATELVLDEYLSQLMNISWTSDKTIIAVGHVNPSTEVYQAFDAKTGESLFLEPVGRLYDISTDGSRIIYYFTPHFSDTAMPPHIRITGINKENNSEIDTFEEPVYTLNSPEYEIRQACFAGAGKVALIEYDSGKSLSTLRFVEINNDKAEIISEIPLNSTKIDPNSIFQIEYFDDRSELYVLSSDSDSDAGPSINLHVLSLRDMKIAKEDIISTGFDINKSHDTNIHTTGSEVIISDISGSGDTTYKSSYRIEANKLVLLDSIGEAPREIVETLVKAVNEYFDGTDDVKIDKIELF